MRLEVWVVAWAVVVAAAHLAAYVHVLPAFAWVHHAALVRCQQLLLLSAAVLPVVCLQPHPSLSLVSH